MDIKQQFASLIDAMVSGNTAEVDRLASVAVQQRAIQQVGEVTKLAATVPDPIEESVDGHIEEAVADDFVTKLAAKLGVRPNAIDAMIDFGEVDPEIIDQYKESKFFTRTDDPEDADGAITFEPGSAFMQFIDSKMPGASAQLVELMDQAAGYVLGTSANKDD